MEVSTGCRPENLGLCSIQLEPVGVHLPGHIKKINPASISLLWNLHFTSYFIPFLISICNDYNTVGKAAAAV